MLPLLEKPSPAAIRSGLLSRDNDSLTGRALRRFLDEAGLPREGTVIWNLVPAWNGTMRVTARERREGMGHLLRLLPLLALLAGRHAAQAAPPLASPRLIVTGHRLPKVRAAFPDRRAAIPAAWADARRTQRCGRSWRARLTWPFFAAVKARSRRNRAMIPDNRRDGRA